ncbi:MAG: FAD:protein FMN transferase [Coriobacteriales bacterium]|nr:FAD:protein FMN transferase [Coriobacteriales bacterium]
MPQTPLGPLVSRDLRPAPPVLFSRPVDRVWLMMLFTKKKSRSRAAHEATAAPLKATVSFIAMGTMMRFCAYGAQAQRFLENAEATTVELDRLLSVFSPHSEVSQLNEADGAWIELSAHTAAVLSEACDYSAQTDGTYDLAIGTLVNLWSASKQAGVVPTPEDIAQALAPCSYRTIERDEQGRFRLLNGARVDLGGIGKGYAADVLCAQARQAGVSAALFSLGTSSVGAWGEKPDGSPWKVGLKTATTADIATYGTVCLRDRFLSSSGDWEQCFVKGGRRYHHILDKSSGYPADTGLRSVAVIADSGAQSEAYSTALFVMGLDDALAFYRQRGDFEAVFLTSDRQVIATPKISTSFEFTGEDMGYHLLPYNY